MPGVTESDVLRFFFASRAARKGRVEPGQERLNQIVMKRALEQQAEREARDRHERAAELDAYERSLD